MPINVSNSSKEQFSTYPDNPNRMKILITGASGFVGSHMVGHSLLLGHETWAALRPTSDRHYLQDERIRFIELDYTDESTLLDQLRDSPRWDVIIHCAGATHCLHRRDFYTANYEATRHLIDALTSLDKVPRQFIFMSTLGVYGPQHERFPYPPITTNDTPAPNTHYGCSKRMAEEYMMGLKDFPYVIFRPTGVYGPRDRDYRILINGIRHHVEVSLGCRHQEITFVYVKDLVKAVFLAIRHGVVRRSYFVSDGNTYTAREFSNTVRKALGNPFVLHIKIPLWIGRAAALLCDGIGHIIGHSLILNSDKYRILSQRNWTCDIVPLVSELGYTPEYDLRRGIAETLRMDG